jgi:hypothetical protein
MTDAPAIDESAKDAVRKSKGTTAEKRPVASRVRNKPRPAIIALAIALIVTAGLAAAYIYTSTGRTMEVFTAVNPISRGDVIDRSDLSTVEIPDSRAIPAYGLLDEKEMVGKTAVVDIPVGTLISPNNVSSAAGLAEGMSIVGISFTANQLPPYPLVSGDPVRIVETPVTQGDPPSADPGTIPATIVAVRFDDVSGNTVVAVSVESYRAPGLAARAATGRVALVLDAIVPAAATPAPVAGAEPETEPEAAPNDAPADAEPTDTQPSDTPTTGTAPEGE